MSGASIHATCLLVGAAGVVIRGASGAGKTGLALALIEEAERSGRFARLVADDRVHLEPVHGRLLARCPAPIAGFVERRGLGILATPSEPAAVVMLVVDLLPEGDVERLPAEPDPRIVIEGISMPHLKIAAGNPAAPALVRTRLAGATPIGPM
jgi:HPr kinase/phosphorylase